jgi:hypothetical protein
MMPRDRDLFLSKIEPRSPSVIEICKSFGNNIGDLVNLFARAVETEIGNIP